MPFLHATNRYQDTTNPYQPKFKKSNRALLSSITDEIRAKPDGGFFITYMGSAVGTSPGRLVETDADFNIIHEWPEDVAGVSIKTVSPPKTPSKFLIDTQYFGRAIQSARSEH